MVSALLSGSSIPGLSSGWGHCIVFLDKTLYSHSAPLHPDVQMGTSDLNAGGNLAIDQHPIQEGVEIFPAASCYRNQDKLHFNGPLGLHSGYDF